MITKEMRRCMRHSLATAAGYYRQQAKRSRWDFEQIEWIGRAQEAEWALEWLDSFSEKPKTLWKPIEPKGTRTFETRHGWIEIEREHDGFSITVYDSGADEMGSVMLPPNIHLCELEKPDGEN